MVYFSLMKFTKHNTKESTNTCTNDMGCSKMGLLTGTGYTFISMLGDVSQVPMYELCRGTRQNILLHMNECTVY